MASQTPAQQAGIPLNQGVVQDATNPAADASFTFAQPWFYLFQQLWQKLGSQYSTPQSAVFAAQTGPKQVTFYSSTTGVKIGYVNLT